MSSLISPKTKSRRIEIITKDQEAKIRPLLQQVVQVLDISFGKIEFTIENKYVHKIVPSETLIDKNKNNQGN